MAHTPGPWRVGKAINGNWIEAGDAVVLKSIARTFYNNVGAATEDANARLIAAAPDLLEACGDALELLNQDIITPEMMNKVGLVLQSAIARAKGE